jgi:hypothetical protein
MSEHGAAVLCDLASPAIAEAVARLASDPARRAALGAAASAFGRQKTWDQLLAPFTALHAEPEAFQGRGPMLPWRLVLRYLAG